MMTEKLQDSWIANFWKRIGALLIDALILGLVGFLLGIALGAALVQIGGWGRLIGFGVALAYFGLMNSKLCNGQTIGKKLLRLRVVDSDNNAIPLIKSVTRSAVLTAPFFLNGAKFSNETVYSYLAYPIAMIIFGGFLATIYLYLFNRVTRQSLHDLIVSTYVVNVNSEKEDLGKVWNVHLAIIVVFFVATAMILVFIDKFSQEEPFKQMHAIQLALLNEREVTSAAVVAGTTTVTMFNKGTKTTTHIVARALLSDNIVNDVELARKLATIVMQIYPEAVNKDALRIILTYGYDIGIWSQWSNRAHDFKPSDFAKLR